MRNGSPIFVAEIRCRRMRCRKCSHTWTVRPRGLVASKHYQPCVVARGISLQLRGATQALVAAASASSRRSVGRWRRMLSALSTPLHGAWRHFAGRVWVLLHRALGVVERLPEVARCEAAD